MVAVLDGHVLDNQLELSSFIAQRSLFTGDRRESQQAAQQLWQKRQQQQYC